MYSRLTIHNSGIEIATRLVDGSIRQQTPPFRLPCKFYRMRQDLELNQNTSYRKYESLTLVAASDQYFAPVKFLSEVSCLERRSRPVAAIVAAEVSAGAGVGASKSLFGRDQ
jgi:hypothetical protein